MTTPEAVLEQHRPMLFGLAYRMLGSRWDADDVLQDAYLRWRDVDPAEVREPRRYLSRIVTRLALDRLRSRGRDESHIGAWLPEPVLTDPSPFEPFTTVADRESVSTATLHLLERLNPLERAVFVLRTAFELPYAEIGEYLDRSEDHCRQLYRRAENRLGNDRTRFTPSRLHHAELLQRFLDAARAGDIAGLAALLREDVILWSDGGGRVRAARRPILGAAKTARFVAGTHRHPGLGGRIRELNGSPALVVTSARSRFVLAFAVADDLISGVYLISDPLKLGAVDDGTARSE